MASSTDNDEAFARELAEAETKIEIDRLFAERLQIALQGRDPTALSWTAETVFGAVGLANIKRSDPNGLYSSGQSSQLQKGKAKAEGPSVADKDTAAVSKSEDGSTSSEEDWYDLVENPIPLPNPVLSACVACEGRFQPTSDPFSSSNLAGSSNQVAYGLRLPKCGHGYCLADLTTYLNNKINEGGSKLRRIECPQCLDKAEAFDDGQILSVFGPTEFASWSNKRVNALRPKLYCPRVQCSAHLFKPDGAAIAQATCPSCNEDLCVLCESIWHRNMACSQYQALPAEQRARQDAQLFELAKIQGWSRCPSCRSFVEKVSGCRDMICRCGARFCYDCLTDWNVSADTCSRGCEGYVAPGFTPYVLSTPVSSPALREGPHPVLERVYLSAA